MLSGSGLLTSVLYDALLIKFYQETSIVNCRWTNILVNSTVFLNFAVSGLCSRGWTIQDAGGSRC